MSQQRPATPKPQRKKGKQLQVIKITPEAHKSLPRTVARRVQEKPKIRQQAPNGNKTVQMIMQSLIDPADCRPVRFSNVFATAPTAIAIPKLVELTAFRAMQSTDVGTVRTGNAFIAQFRDPLRHVIFQDPNHDDKPYEYDLAWQSPYQGPQYDSTDPQYSNDMTIEENAGEVEIPVAFATANSAYQPHGNYLYAGIDKIIQDGRKYIWMDIGAVFTAACTTTATPLDIRLNQWTPSNVNRRAYNIALATPPDLKTPKDKKDNNNPTPPAKPHKRPGHAPAALSGNATITKSGYYSISVAADQSDSGIDVEALYFTITGTGPVMCHRSLPYVESAIAKTQGFAVRAASMLFTNTTDVLTRDGTIVIAQIPKGTDWLELALGSRPIGSMPLSKSFSANNGSYSWLRPTQDADFDMKTVADVSAYGTVTTTFFNLRNESEYVAQMVTTGHPDTFTGTLTYNAVVEFETTDNWFSVASPDVSKPAYDAALLRLRGFTQFYENPTHIKDIVAEILGKAKTVLDAGLKYGPEISSMMGKVGSWFG